MDTDFFVIETLYGSWLVSTEMAYAVDAVLARRRLPEWVTFVDLSGARVRLRSRAVIALTQSTADQRAERRALVRALEEEEAAE